MVSAIWLEIVISLSRLMLTVLSVNTSLPCFGFIVCMKNKRLVLIDFLLLLLFVFLSSHLPAMGLATLEVMQAVQRTWANSKVRMNGKTRLMQWRDMFDIAVKWRR